MDVLQNLKSMAKRLSDKPAGADDELLAKLPGDIAGRYETGGSGNILTSGVLRVTVTDPYISFDAFKPPIAFTETYSLGGRQDWSFSCHGPLQMIAATDRHLDAMAICEMSTASGLAEAREPRQATIGLRVNLESRTIESVDIALFQDRGGVYGAWREDTLDSPDQAFRRVGFEVGVDPLVADEFGEVLNIVLGDGELSLTSVMARAGIKPVFERIKDFETLAHLPQDRTAACTVSEAADERCAHTQDWWHTLNFMREAGHSGLTGHAGHERPFGISFGIAGPADRFRSRYASAINVPDIAAVVDDEGPDIAGLSQTDKTAWMVRYTCLHEIGHLLNMPHSWERHVAHPLLGPPAAHGVTWMQYPFLYPVGPVNRAFLGKGPAAEDERKAFAKSYNARFYQVAKREEAAFTAAEQRFLRHAPLNHIAQGGHTFLDHLLPPPQISKPASPDGQSLEIVVPEARDGGIAYTAMSSLNLFIFQKDGLGWEQFPYLPCAVRLRGHTFDAFDLVSGRLQLIIKLMDHKRKGSFADRDVTRAVPIDMSHDLGRRQSALIVASENAPEEIKNATLPKDMLRLPWLEKRKMAELFQGRLVRDFVLQAVFFEGANQFRSAPVTVTFGKGDFGDRSRANFGRKTVDHPGGHAAFFGDDPLAFQVRPEHQEYLTCRANDDTRRKIALHLSGPDDLDDFNRRVLNEESPAFMPFEQAHFDTEIRHQLGKIT